MNPVTDIHAHFVPAWFPPSLGGEASFIAMNSQCGCSTTDVLIDGARFRTVTDESWRVDRRLAVMDQTGIGRQLVSPMPELLSYWRPAPVAADMCEHVNMQLAELVDECPTRFTALGAVPLQDPDMATAALETLMADKRFAGVELGANINGIPLGDPRFRPFFATAERLGCAILVHPLQPIKGYPILGAMNAFAAFPCETALCAVSLMTSGILTDHPNLRLALSHGGGALALLLPRLEHGWETTSQVREALHERPSAMARRMYYDSLVYDPETLGFLIRRFGSERICLGTDRPFAIAEADPVGRIDTLMLSNTDRDLVLRDNASRFAPLRALSKDSIASGAV